MPPVSRIHFFFYFPLLGLAGRFSYDTKVYMKRETYGEGASSSPPSLSIEMLNRLYIPISMNIAIADFPSRILNEHNEVWFFNHPLHYIDI